VRVGDRLLFVWVVHDEGQGAESRASHSSDGNGSVAL
jgi:hypothetical protein